jgi:hypothetical protein
MAFDFVGKGMGIKHNSAQNFLREEFQGRRANNSRGGEREGKEEAMTEGLMPFHGPLRYILGRIPGTAQSRSNCLSRQATTSGNNLDFCAIQALHPRVYPYFRSMANRVLATT